MGAFHENLRAEAAAEWERRKNAPPPAPAPKGISIQTQFSSGFGDWLIRHEVGLVCSTYQTGHLLFFGVRPDGMPVPSGAAFSRAVGIAEVTKAKGAVSWARAAVADPTNGDIVERLRLEGDAMELSDVGVVPEVRCATGLNTVAHDNANQIQSDNYRAR